MGEIIFTGSDPSGNHAKIRKAQDGYSVFTWRDIGMGVHQWREQHGLKPFGVAFKLATDYLQSDFSSLQ